MPEEWRSAGDTDDEEIGPDDPDYDLSEEHGYLWEPKRRHWPVHPLVLALVSVLVILALLLPGLLVLARG